MGAQPDNTVVNGGEAAPSSGSVASGALMCLLSMSSIQFGAALSAPAIAAYGPAGASRLRLVFAALILAPEGLAAVRAAKGDRLQTSLNLALGSALATIGLTIPAVAILSIVTDLPISLGLDAKSAVLLFLSLIVASQTLANGRTTVLQGAIHLMLFAVYLFTTFVP